MPSSQQYGKVELIGWLYQYYISEKKDEVFDTFKNQEGRGQRHPCRHPNLHAQLDREVHGGEHHIKDLDKHPTSPLKGQMTYLVENEADEPAIHHRPGGATFVIDPACGSGHILVEGFDLIYQIEEFASQNMRR